MTEAQQNLLAQARESLSAAKLLSAEGYLGFAASRAYYSMFYVAEALLLEEGLAFSKHSAVHAAFGERLVATGAVPPEFHRYLLQGMEVRLTGDYDYEMSVGADEVAE